MNKSVTRMFAIIVWGLTLLLAGPMLVISYLIIFGGNFSPQQVNTALIMALVASISGFIASILTSEGWDL